MGTNKQILLVREDLRSVGPKLLVHQITYGAFLNDRCSFSTPRYPHSIYLPRIKAFIFIQSEKFNNSIDIY